MTDAKRPDMEITRIDRIRKMECCLDAAAEALCALEAALDGYEAALPGLRALTEYYDSGNWQQDFEADEAGLLPPDLKRGVLSEDAVYDLLADHEYLLRRLRKLQEQSETPKARGDGCGL